jgi:SulP family sulfate permease
MNHSFLRNFSGFRNYSWPDAQKDLLAGVTVAAISLPQAMAYALIAGVDPRFGIYSAIVVTFVASIFGSSSHLINGPTNAISLVVFSALAFFDPDARFNAYQGMFLLGIMVGTIQILIAVFKLGDLTRYISESVVLGFMAGAGFLVALGQVGNFFGMHDQGNGHQHVLLRFWLTITRGGGVSSHALEIGAGTVVLVLILRKLARRYRLPQIDMLVALIAATSVAFALGWAQPGITGKGLLSVVGNVPATLPAPHIPEIQSGWISEMSGSALAIACLGLLEALAISKSIAHETRQALDFNRQCLAEGLANLAGGFFQCLPGSGSLTRSAINYQAGAVSRMSGLFASGSVAIVLLLLAPLMRYVPKAALAGLLMVIASRLIDWKRMRSALGASRYDAGLVLLTAFSSVFISVEFSILIGVGISILLFVPRAARLRGAELVVSDERVVRDRLPSDPECTGMIIFDLDGDLFFGAAPELDGYFAGIEKRTRDEGIRCVILRVKSTNSPDMVCMERFHHFILDMDRHGVFVLLCGVRPEFARVMKNMRFEDVLPESRVFLEEPVLYSSTLKAVRLGYELMGEVSCTHCARIQAPEETRDLYYLV